MPTSVSGYYEVLNDNAQSEGESWNITGGVGATAPGDLLQIWNYGGVGNTNALFAAKAASASGDYNFVVDNDGLCIDIPNASTASGVQLQQYTCTRHASSGFQPGAKGLGGGGQRRLLLLDAPVIGCFNVR